MLGTESFVWGNAENEVLTRNQQVHAKLTDGAIENWEIISPSRSDKGVNQFIRAFLLTGNVKSFSRVCQLEGNLM